ncbi:MAG: anti-anti-sigma factor [Alkaliphilus sp.]|nr:STAS domain-containing protein [Alkaliphilus transvaalensis]PHS32287.1 MAG: anti-anti-sigma factor [Alkaliphilus sp.]
MSLDIKTTYIERETVWCVELVGEIDIYTANKFREMFEELYEKKRENIEIDAKNLDYIDSTGLGVMIGALKKLRKENKKITIINVKSNIKRVLEITGIDKIFIEN